MMQILILDDDDLFGQTLARSLQRNSELPFDVEVTTTEDEARDAVIHAAEPFDVFLIDHRLGPGSDGIAVFQELRRLSPNTEAIIFTGFDEPTAGLEAYQAGAHRYLPKPFDTRELVWILRSLRKWHDTQYERDWLKVLTEVAEEAQRALSVKEVADIVVQGGLRLGFERARLWRLSEDSHALVGISQMGNHGLGAFAGCLLPMSASLYAQRTVRAREPVVFLARELGEGFLDRRFAQQGFEPPVGEWVQLPLWADTRLWGILTLDNASQARPLRPEQRSLLRLFGRQIVAALERARLHDTEERTSKELAIINQIGQRVTARAALDDLDMLLREVRVLVSELIDTRNFSVVLLDSEAYQLDFRLHIENNHERPRQWQSQGTGLIGHMIAENRPLLLAKGEIGYCKSHDIPRPRRPSRCWLGVPLQVGERAVGAIIIQNYEHEGIYTEDDRRLLMAVSDQVAGVIQTARLREQEAENNRQLRLLHHASEEIMKLAEENEDWLWQATLTAATAKYALSFNRAAAFLSEENGTRLRGCMGVGHFNRQRARHDWNGDRHINLDFDAYLQQLRAGQLHSTPVEEAVRGWVLNVNADGNAFQQVLREGQRVIVRSAEAMQRLPQEFVERFGAADYAIVPIRSGSKVLGLTIVDNMHDKEPLRDRSLDHLETLFAQAALTLEALHQRLARDKLIDLNYTIMSEINVRTLGETLVRVCEAARTVTRADYVVIYPLRRDAEPYIFDVDNAGRAGHEQKPRLSGPRPAGMSIHILRTGMLVVEDVTNHPDPYDGERLVEHPSLQRERVRALIGVPVRDVATNERLGVLFLNYRTPQMFTEQDVHQAKSFADLSAVAIRNHRVAHRMREGLAAAETARQDREKELDILRGVLEQALTSDTEEEKVIQALLNAARALVDHPDIRVGLVLREWVKPDHMSHEPREVRIEHFLHPDGTRSRGSTSEIYQGISGQVLQTGRAYLTGDVRVGELAQSFRDDGIGTRSELDVPTRLGAQVIGAFNIESPAADAFTPVHQGKIERLAAAAGLALDNVRRQKHLHNLLVAAEAVVAPFGLKETLDAVLEAARQAAPGLSTLTIWYREPENGRMRLGPHFGVRHEAELGQEEPTKGGLLSTVLQSHEPIWAPVARDDDRLKKRFIEQEAIESTAAFPLEASNDTIGAMFFSYRQFHEFSHEERALFPTLAAITAASIRDAALLETARKERDRLRAAMAITEAVGTTLDLNETFRQIMATLRNLLAHVQPSVLTLTCHPAEQTLDFTSPSREFYRIDNAEYLGCTRVPIDGPSIASQMARQSLATGEVQVCNVGDAERDPNYLKLISGTRSELCLTLMSAEGLLGVLVLESPEPNAFSEDDVAMVSGVGQQMSMAIDRAYQSAELSFKTTVAAATTWATEIAHDVNREVGLIRNRAYWLSEEPALSPEGKHYTHQIEESANRLAGTMDVMRNLPKFSIVLDTWLKQRAEAIVRERGAGVEVIFELGCHDVSVLVPSIALERVLRHLVRNALEAMQGNGCLKLSTRRVGDAWVEALIEDSGPGVPDHVRQLLFMQRVSTKSEEGGLGLLFVRFIVQEMLGGNVRLLPPETNRGAVFAVTLPIGQEEPGDEHADH